MIKSRHFNSVLVPTDFSENSWRAFEHAQSLVNGDDAEILVIHVIDHATVLQIVEAGITDEDTIFKSLRKKVIQKLKPYADASTNSINVDTLVCEGEPFVEIIRKSNDFAVDAIVMSKLGQRSSAKLMMFGSTAEKVIRASKRQVVVLPE